MIYRGSVLPQSFLFFYLIICLVFEIHLIIMLLIAVLLASLTLELRIVNENLLFQLTIFKFCIVKKQLLPSNIDVMKFKRTGWAQKLVLIKVKKGLNIRITAFHPKTVYKNLLDYGTDYDVPVYKTKDYKILERMEKTRKKI